MSASLAPQGVDNTPLGTVQSQPGSVHKREIVHSFQTTVECINILAGPQPGGGRDNYRIGGVNGKPNAYVPVSDIFAQRAAIKAYKKMRQHDFDLDKHSQADTRSMISNQSKVTYPHTYDSFGKFASPRLANRYFR